MAECSLPTPSDSIADDLVQAMNSSQSAAVQDACVQADYLAQTSVATDDPKSSKSLYVGQGFYHPVKGIYAWEFDFLITQNFLANNVVDDYEKSSWTKHHYQLLEFEEHSDKSMEGVTLNIEGPSSPDDKWTVQEKTSRKIKKERVDHMNTKEVSKPPHCRLALIWKGERRHLLPDIYRKVNLEGAKDTKEDFFNIVLPEAECSLPTLSDSVADNLAQGEVSSGPPYDQRLNMITSIGGSVGAFNIGPGSVQVDDVTVKSAERRKATPNSKKRKRHHKAHKVEQSIHKNKRTKLETPVESGSDSSSSSSSVSSSSVASRTELPEAAGLASADPQRLRKRRHSPDDREGKEGVHYHSLSKKTKKASQKHPRKAPKVLHPKHHYANHLEKVENCCPIADDMLDKAKVRKHV